MNEEYLKGFTDGIAFATERLATPAAAPKQKTAANLVCSKCGRGFKGKKCLDRHMSSCRKKNFNIQGQPGTLGKVQGEVLR